VVARAVVKSSSLKLVGVSGFEGIISESQTQTAEQRVDNFLDDMRGLADAMIAENLFQDVSEILISAGGSVFFDRVATKLVGQNSAISERIVIRSGCYLSHDDGVIDQLSPYGSASHVSGDVFRAALEVWGVVLSRPEPSRVIVGIGKRDVSTDGMLPIAKKILRRGNVQPQNWLEGTRAVRVDDQHLYLNVDANDEVAVGDLIGFGISHPCTTFDKWRAIPIANDKYQVVAIANTKF
jgi:D-serine deaminase-like pyridoxal phosphate-dependent protein